MISMRGYKPLYTAFDWYSSYLLVAETHEPGKQSDEHTKNSGK